MVDLIASQLKHLDRVVHFRELLKLSRPRASWPSSSGFAACGSFSSPPAEYMCALRLGLQQDHRSS